MKQLSFIPKAKREFGGSLLKGKRKARRPLSFKDPIHLVIKAEKAQGKFAMSPSDVRLRLLIQKMAFCFGVRVYGCAVNWTHVHLVIRIKCRKDYVSFIRAVTGAMVLKLRAPKGFWALRPYTKIGTWGRQFQAWIKYIGKNELESQGLIKKSIIARSDQRPDAEPSCKLILLKARSGIDPGLTEGSHASKSLSRTIQKNLVL